MVAVRAGGRYDEAVAVLRRAAEGAEAGLLPRERLSYPLLGVNAPGLLLECATLTAPGDRARVASAAGLDALARAITDGLEAYQRNE